MRGLPMFFAVLVAVGCGEGTFHDIAGDPEVRFALDFSRAYHSSGDLPDPAVMETDKPTQVQSCHAPDPGGCTIFGGGGIIMLREGQGKEWRCRVVAHEYRHFVLYIRTGDPDYNHDTFAEFETYAAERCAAWEGL